MEVPFEPIRLLYVDPDETAAAAVADGLGSTHVDFEVSTAESTATALQQLHHDHVDCVVAADDLGADTGIALLETLREEAIELPFVLRGDADDTEIARRAVAAGVDRYRPVTDDADASELAADIVAAVTEYKPETALSEETTGALLRLDDRWRLTFLNECARAALCEVSGEEHTVEQLRGQPIWEAVPEMTGTTFEQRCREAMETGESVTFEECYEPSQRWFAVRASPSVSGLTVSLDDVTDRRTCQREVERREEVLRRIYQNIADKKLSFEEKVEQLLEIGQEELEMTYGSLSRIDGDTYTLEVVVGPDHDVIQDGTTFPLASTNCERVLEQQSHLVLADLESEAPELAERLVVTELGVESYVGAPVFVDDAVEGTFCLYDFETHGEAFSDWEVTLVDLMASWVSYERERERQRRELERERNRLDDVASTLSHDLRNPLTTANLRLDLASEECNSDHLADVETALGRIDQLVSDVLAMARLGKHVIDPEPVPFESLVREAWQTTSVGGGELRISDDCETIVGDEGRLRQLFENLFRNAAEHGSASPHGQAPDAAVEGESAEDATREPDIQSRDSLVVEVGPLEGTEGFYVADNGPGVPESDREQIFERGYSTQQDGTGFGLAIVKEIAEVHEGSVTVTESEAGGARFEIRGIEVE